jgi:tRNA pseudouridine13 synthase
LRGNLFSIVLRNIQGDQSAIDQSLSSLRDNGFINYFGMQRFGTGDIPTHEVGRAILGKNYEKAAKMILPGM